MDRRLLWALGALFVVALALQPKQVEASNVGGHITCDRSIVYDASTNGSTQLVGVVAGSGIYVCGYVIFSAGTANVKLIYGTGTTCGTGTTSITPAYQLTAQTGVAENSAEFRGLLVPTSAAGNELCINTSAGVAVQAVVYFTQMQP